MGETLKFNLTHQKLGDAAEEYFVTGDLIPPEWISFYAVEKDLDFKLLPSPDQVNSSLNLHLDFQPLVSIPKNAHPIFEPKYASQKELIQLIEKHFQRIILGRQVIGGEYLRQEVLACLKRMRFMPKPIQKTLYSLLLANKAMRRCSVF